MPISIKEPLHYFREDGITEVFYPASEITLFQNRNKIKVTMISEEQFDIFHKRINRANHLALMDSDHNQFLFKVTYDKSNNFYFRKNNVAALEFLKICGVVSNALYDDTLAQISNPMLFPINNNQLGKKLETLEEEPGLVITEVHGGVEEKEGSESIQQKAPVKCLSTFFSHTSGSIPQIDTKAVVSSPKL
jgi:hypothetical protein